MRIRIVFSNSTGGFGPEGPISVADEMA